MRGEWNLREWETEYWCSFFKKKIEYLKAGYSEKIDLTKENLCPENVIDILEAMGYESDDCAVNSWEQDADIYFTNGKTNLRLFYCGRTFRMELMLADKEDY